MRLPWKSEEIRNGKVKSEQADEVEEEKTKSDLKSFQFCDKTAYITESTKADFESLPAPKVFSDNEETNLKADSKLVSRIGDSLVFKLENGKKAYLMNNTGERAEEQYTAFKYLGNVENSKYHAVKANYYEGGCYWLINSQIGDTAYSTGFPIVSPDKTMLIAGNSDLESHYTLNGLELYKNTTPIEKICTIELADWGVNEIRWLGNSSILAKADIYDASSENSLRTEYLKVEWK